MKVLARRISGGVGEGEVLATEAPLSLLGGIDRETGVVLDEASGIRGETVAGRVLVFPRGKGSTAGSYVLYALKARDRAPASLVAGTAEAVVATGAILSAIPMVDRVPTDLFRTGDRARVDADAGYVELPEVETRHVVTAFLLHGDRVLILRRSGQVGSFEGHWGGVSGYLEGKEEAAARARREIREETGIEDPELLAAGAVVRARQRTGNVVWAVHPFLFRAPSTQVTLDWEHEAYRWIRAEELPRFETVPKLQEALESAQAGLRPPGGRR